MTPEELTKQLENIPITLEKWVNDDAPIIVGKIASDFFTENFDRQGFLNNGLHKWDDVKRRQRASTKGAAKGWAILTGGTGNLKRGNSYIAGIGQVVIYNDARSPSGFAYGIVHNRGVNNAGRSRNVTIPKRQFMGDSKELGDLINAEIERKLNELKQ